MSNGGGTYYRRDAQAIYDRIVARNSRRADDERAERQRLAALEAQTPGRAWRFLVDDVGRWVEYVVVVGRTEEEALAAVRQGPARWALALARRSWRLELVDANA